MSNFRLISEKFFENHFFDRLKTLSKKSQEMKKNNPPKNSRK